MKINVSFNKLQHVVHIADVHIRLFRRHEEYEAAFDKLYADINDKNLNDFIIVLAGDIVHAKTDMSPEMVEVTSRFLKNIANIAPTIMIAGNHDCNLANANRMDALTPIVNNLQHPNLHYIKGSGVVHVADTAFAVCSIFDEQGHWPTADEVSSDISNKIALYHGPVHGAVTDANFVITNRHVHVDTFDGFDMVMLGDIHRHQILQNANPIVAYASSLIQQNHGETLDGHGWCLWDIPSRSVEFVPLENDYGYVTLEVKDGAIAYPVNMPKNIRARLFTENLDNTQVKKLITTLRGKYNVIEMAVNKSRVKKAINRESQLKLQETLDLTNVATQNQLIQDWILRNEPNIDTEILGTINKLNRDLNSQLKHDDQSRNINWRPLKFIFSNMFSYGENNEIDFSNMHGVYGIFAPNASGKSSIMDALMFCLYDKTPRAFKGDHIINNRKDTFECELTIEIDGEVYGIKRNGSRKKNGDVKVDVSFWKLEANGDRVSLNGEDRRDTNAAIRSYVGTYEDFIMTSMSGQLGNSLFIDKSHSERKDLLMQFMGLNVFDTLHDIANDNMKEISGVLKRFKKSDVTDQIADAHGKLMESNNSLNHAESEKEQYEQILKELELEYNQQQNNKRLVPDTSGNLIELESLLAKTSTLLKNAQKNYDYTQAQFNTSSEECIQLQEDFEAYDVEKLRQAVDNYNRLNDLLVKGNGALRIVNTKIEEKVKFKNKLLGYKYNPDCDVCVTNNKSVITDLESVNIELDELNTKRLIQEDSITNIIEELEPLKADKEAFVEMTQLSDKIKATIQTKNRLKVELDSAQVSIERNQNKIDQIQSEIETYKLNEEAIIHNHKVDVELVNIDSNIKNAKLAIQRFEKESRDLHGNISVLESKKKDLISRLKEAEQLEDQFEAYSYYMDAIGRDGIPYEIISKTIPTIESEINNILAQIVDFTVSLEVDGKNINGKLSYDYDRVWPLENSSGMERFVSSLAIRVALINASNLPKPNFLIVDEGFGVLDPEHMHSMQTLFNLLKTQFDFILIVSHLDTARDMVDSLIEIKKEDGYSQISV